MSSNGILYTNDSLKILEFLFNNSYENNHYSQELEGMDPIVFRDLYDFLKNIEKRKYCMKTVLENISREVKIHDFSLNKYVAKDVCSYIKININVRYDYVLRIDNKVVNICIKCHKHLSENKFNIMLKRIIYAISTVVNISDEPKTIDMVIYLTPCKKKLMGGLTKRESLKVEEINSGSTLCTHQPHVIVCREEEFYKVIIHELIHAMNYDIKSDINSISEIIKNKMNIELPHNQFEAYTEIWANILNAYFMANVMNLEKAEDTFNLFMELIQYERLWSLYQVSKVLYLTDCDINHNSDSHIQYNKLCKLNLHTNVFAYFILRSFLMFNINDFLKNMKKNNKNHIDLNGDIQRYNEYCLEIINKTIYNRHYKSLLKKNIEYLLKIKNNKKFLQKTLRMSACELKIY